MTDRTRADQEGPFREFSFEEWLRDGVEGMRGKVEQKKAEFDPAQFRRHLRNAQKEQLLAMRSLIDNAIEYLEKEESKGSSESNVPPKPPKPA
jgi:hypothetical protein